MNSYVDIGIDTGIGCSIPVDITAKTRILGFSYVLISGVKHLFAGSLFQTLNLGIGNHFGDLLNAVVGKRIAER